MQAYNLFAAQISIPVFAKIFCCVLNGGFVGKAGSVNLSKYNSC